MIAVCSEDNGSNPPGRAYTGVGKIPLSCSTKTGGLQRSMQDHPSDSAAFYSLFETPIGLCGLAWNGRGVIGFQLPEDDASRMRARIAKRFPGIVEASPPPDIQGIITDVTAL